MSEPHGVDQLTFCRVGFKWRVAVNKLVRQNTECPQINCLAMLLVLDHLWRQVVQCAAHRCPPVARCMYAPSEIRDFEASVNTHEQIFGLDVAVDHIFGVQVLQRIGHLRDVARSDGLLELAAGQRRHVLVELPLAGELDHEEQTTFVVEVTV